MKTTTTSQSTVYTPIARSLHWLIALLIIGLLAAGFLMGLIPSSPLKIKIYGLHKSFGLLVLFLFIIRALWRITHKPPKPLPSHAPWEKHLSKLVHVLLYALLFMMPLSGWLMSSAGDFPARFFGLFDMPDLIAKDRDVFRFMREAHEYMAFGIIGLVALHVAGALKHHIIDQDETLTRMLGRPAGRALGGALVLLTLAAMAAPPIIASANKPESKPETKHQKTKTTPDTDNIHEGNAWHIISEKSRIAFDVTQYGTPFSGEFEEFSGEIVFEPENLDESHVEITIPIGSLNTGSRDRDSQAMQKEWFDQTTYPDAVFTSSGFSKTGDNQYIAHGKLKIRGVSIDIIVPFSLSTKIKPDRVLTVMDGHLELDRTAFGIGQGEWANASVIGHKVPVRIHVEAEKNMPLR